MMLATSDITTTGQNYAIVAPIPKDDSAFSKSGTTRDWFTRPSFGAGVEGYVRFDSKFAAFFKKLELISSTPDPYWDAEQPNTISIDWASRALTELAAIDLLPERVVASAEGGVGICFMEGDRYADIEFLNNGRILAVKSDRQSVPEVWTVAHTPQGLTAALGVISDFLRTI